MESFVLAVDSGGLAAAARSLRISRSLVSRHIGELEQRLGTRLLVRTTRRLALTESGTSYYRFCKKILAELETEEHHLDDLQQEIQGELRITAPKSFGADCLAKPIAAFGAAHPRLNLSVVLGDFTFGTYDFLERGFDLSIKYSPLVSSNLMARRIGSIRMVLCASPKYLQRQGAPKKAVDLERHKFLWHSDPNLEGQSLTLLGRGRRIAVRVRPGFSSNSVPVLRDAARAGLGITVLPHYAIGDDLRRGRLRCVLRGYEVAPHDVYAVHPHSGLVPRKISAFIDHLSAWTAAHGKRQRW